MMAPKTIRYASEPIDLADIEDQSYDFSSPRPIEIGSMAAPAISICNATDNSVDFGMLGDLERNDPHAQKKQANRIAISPNRFKEVPSFERLSGLASKVTPASPNSSPRTIFPVGAASRNPIQPTMTIQSGAVPIMRAVIPEGKMQTQI